MIRRIRRTILWRGREWCMWRTINVPEGMELMAYNRRCPDEGEARSVDTVDMVPMCKAVSCVMRVAPDKSSDTS